ncbi:MAG: nucleotidyltransferase domain-containing protein [Candidatus Methanoplasma sp.]|jgi:predicted nucleotidyltransferase|nr:nucleotidyltransferase domain-containing protein [Candidatus Methanoplasma sp.]
MDSEGKGLTFNELREIVAPIAKKHGMVRIYLFGSRSRGDNKENSDYDFCIAAPEWFDLFDLEHFMRDLREALGTDVDVISEEGISDESYFKEDILRDRRILFEA